MRRYESRLREGQVAETRDRILRAFVDELGTGAEDFSIARVAERAGVAVRTVYHHFPTREAQVDAVAVWLEARVAGDETGPRDVADLPAYAERMYRRAIAHEAETRASLAPGVAERVRAKRRQRRLARIDRVVAELGLTADQARRVGAALKGIISADFGFGLVDRHGLTRDETPAVARELVAAVIARVRSDRHAF